MDNSKIVLTTQDIVGKEFSIVSNGFKPQEVDEFLDMVIKDYITYEKKIRHLKGEISSLNEELSKARSETRKLRELESIASDDKQERTVNNVDLLRRISQLEKIVYGKSE